MTKIRVGLRNGYSKVVEFSKPFEYITAKDITDAVGEKIIGWAQEKS